MIFPALFYKCSRNLGEKLQQAIIAPTPKTKFEYRQTNTSMTIYIFALLLFGYYVNKKAPYMVRLSGLMCVLSWLVKLQSVREYVNHVLNNHVPEEIGFFASWLHITLQQNFTAVHTLFFTLVFIRFWWCPKVNIVRNMESAGFEFLEAEAKRQNLSRREVLKSRLALKRTKDIPPVFPNGWIPLLESHDLEIGKTIPIFALGESFAVFRGYSGKAFVLDAFCPHLGANLAVGGIVRGDCLECPFHRWKIRGQDAMCVDIPYTDNNNIPVKAQGKVWLSEEKNGFIYIWFHAEKAAPSWNIPDISEIKDGTWSYRGRTEHIVFCHIQEIPENGADASHLQPLHSETTFAGTNPGRFHKKWKIIDHRWDASWERCPEPDSHMAKLSLSHYMRLFDIPVPLTNAKFDIKQIGPATVHLRLNSSFGKGVFIQSIIPEQSLQHRLIHQFYAEFKFPQWVSSTYLKMEDIMVQRDIIMWNYKKFVKHPILMKEDRNIRRFRRWYEQFYSDNSLKYEQMKEKLALLDF